MDASILSPDELATALRLGAVGYTGPEASVALLVDGGSWLQRPDFVEHVIVAEDDGEVLATVDWDAVIDAGLEASAGEERMLRLAAELAGADTGQPLGELLGGFDERNLVLVVRAVLHACRGSAAPVMVVGPFET